MIHTSTMGIEKNKTIKNSTIVKSPVFFLFSKLIFLCPRAGIGKDKEPIPAMDENLGLFQCSTIVIQCKYLLMKHKQCYGMKKKWYERAKRASTY